LDENFEAAPLHPKESLCEKRESEPSCTGVSEGRGDDQISIDFIQILMFGLN
jgi:hypothetical protein